MAPLLEFQTLTTVAISDEEGLSSTLSPEHGAPAIHPLYTDGLVCIDIAMDLDHVAILHEKLS